MKLLTGLLFALAASGAHAQVIFSEETEQAQFDVELVADGMTFPWDMEFLPGGDILISEYDGALRRIVDGALAPEIIKGVETTPDGGLRGIVAHPDFENNRQVYLCYASGTREDNHTRIARGTLDGFALTDVEDIFIADNAARELAHYGCRLLWDKDGYLIATFGDRRHHPDESQSLGDHYGVIVRLDENGNAAPGNPFADRAGALPEIFAYGIRNAQGAVYRPGTEELWISEHGPRGGDEVNIVERGANYGWPVATFGIDYSGDELTDTPLLDGVAPPLYYWYPSIAPSSIAFYDGNEFPKWVGDLFITTLSSRRLLRLELNGDRILRVEPLFAELDTRLRDVSMGPDGALYVLTDSGDGRLLRIRPAQSE